MKSELHDELRSPTGGAWPQALIHATHGFMSSQVLFTLEEIGAFEQLRVGPLSTTQLALATKCDPNALERLVTAGVTLGLLERNAQRESLIPTQLLPLLDPSSPRCITGIFEHFRRVSLRAFGVLTDAIRHGRSCFWEDHGEHVEGAFESMYSTAEGTSRFAGAMWALGYHAASELCEMFPPLGSRWRKRFLQHRGARTLARTHRSGGGSSFNEAGRGGCSRPAGLTAAAVLRCL